MNQRKKSKFRRRINRMKNKIQYLRKRVGVPVTCFLLCFSLIAVTLFATKQQAYATGVEEMFYYTYWDLISGLFAETGYQFSSPDSYYTKPDRASGKDVWDNFCTWVENKAKVLSLPVEVVNDTIFKELENLPNVVDAAGVSMSEALAQLLGTVLPTAADSSFSNSFDVSSVDKIESELLSWTNATGYSRSDKLRDLAWNIYRGDVLNIIYDGYGSYMCFLCDKPLYIDIEDDEHSFPFKYYDNNGDLVPLTTTLYYVFSSSKSVSCSSSVYVTVGSAYSWIVKGGSVCVDGTALSDMARVKVKEKTEDRDGVYIPGVGWKTSWDLWRDQVNNRVTTDAEDEAWNSRYKFDNDDDDKKKQKKEDNNKDKLPVVLPIPFKPGKDTEKDTETETESESEKDTEPAPGPIPKPDPTEDGSEDDTESQKHIQDVITNAGGSSGGNWKKLFPFCIPWDIMTLIKSMNAEKKAPHFKYEHTFKGINYTFSIDVDMSDYWKYIKIFRWGMTIFFIIGLFFLTVKFTTFVHRGS